MRFAKYSLAAALILMPLGGARAAKPAVGKITLAQGDVFRAEQEEGPFRRLTENAEIFEGDFLKTEKDARLEARLSDRSILRLAPESRLKVEQARFTPKTEEKQVSVKLMLGRLWAKVTHLVGGESKFDVTTQNAVAGVRGTVFGVDRGKDQSTTIKVFSGKVLVSNKPVYLKEGTKKGERVQVAGPQEISKKQWEEAIAGALQQIRVAAAGDFGKPETFAAADVEKDEWVAWNQARDGKGE